MVGWIAVVSGWFVAEVGRQPWTVFELMRTAESHSPAGAAEVLLTLFLFFLAYALIFGSGGYYIYRLVRQGLSGHGC